MITVHVIISENSCKPRDSYKNWRTREKEPWACVDRGWDAPVGAVGGASAPQDGLLPRQ